MIIYLVVEYCNYDPLFYIIIGAYSNKKDADDFLEKLADSHNTTVNFRTDGTKYAVTKSGYSAYSTQILEVK